MWPMPQCHASSHAQWHNRKRRRKKWNNIYQHLPHHVNDSNATLYLINIQFCDCYFVIFIILVFLLINSCLSFFISVVINNFVRILLQYPVVLHNLHAIAELFILCMETWNTLCFVFCFFFSFVQRNCGHYIILFI